MEKDKIIKKQGEKIEQIEKEMCQMKIKNIKIQEYIKELQKENNKLKQENINIKKIELKDP